MNYSKASYVNQMIFNNKNHYEGRFFSKKNARLCLGENENM